MPPINIEILTMKKRDMIVEKRKLLARRPKKLETLKRADILCMVET